MKSLTAVLSTLLFAVLFAACDRMTSVTFVNNTGEELEFYTQSDVQTALLGTRAVNAESALEYGLIPLDYLTLRVAATREDGQWVFDHKYSRAELERQGRKVAVSSLEPISPPADVYVIPPTGRTPPVLPSRVAKPDSTSSPTVR